MAPRGAKQIAKPDSKNSIEQAPPTVPEEVTPAQVPLPPDTTQTETKLENKEIPKKSESEDIQSPRSVRARFKQRQQMLIGSRVGTAEHGLARLQPSQK